MSTEAAPAIADPVENGTAHAVPAEQPGHKVFAGNLAYSTTDDGLKAFFAPVAADILSTQIIYRGQRSAGYGFVAFNTLEAAQNAAELLNRKELDGRVVIVEIAKPAEEKQYEKSEKKPIKRRVSKKVRAAAAAATDAVTPAKDEAGDASAAEKTEGETKPKKKRNIRKPKKTKAAAASTTEGDAAPAPDDGVPAAPAVPKEKREKKPRAPRPPKPARAPGEAPLGEPSKTMLFIANLGFAVDDAALSTLFTEAGIEVHSARVVRRRWGQPRRSKGYGFVDVGSEEQQQKALETLQGKEVGGREIVLKIAIDSDVKTANEEIEDATTDGPVAVAVAA